MGKVIELRLTKKAIYRAAVKEMTTMYRLPGGGVDPMIDDASRGGIWKRGNSRSVVEGLDILLCHDHE
ncbi:MAG: hypothetical protein P8X65_09215 [Syntrophobacterales bacterium]|jgi:hypothetical protein